MICPICGNFNTYICKMGVRDNNDLWVDECMACGHQFLDTNITEEELKTFYDNDMQDKLSGVPTEYDHLKFIDTNRHIRFIKLNYPNNVKLLDVGSGRGYFIKGLREEGYLNSYGQEISDSRGNYDYIIHKSIEEISDRYDVITIFHVIEHVKDPIKFLKSVKKLLTPSGIIYMETPNQDERLRRKSREYNNAFYFTAHLHYFDRNALNMAIIEAGLHPYVSYIQRYGKNNYDRWINLGIKEDTPSPVLTTVPEQQFEEDLILSGETDTLWAEATL